MAAASGFFAFIMFCSAVTDNCVVTQPQPAFPTVQACAEEAKRTVESIIAQPEYPGFVARGGTLAAGCIERAADYDWSDNASEVVKELRK